MTLTYNDLPAVEFASDRLAVRPEFPKFLEKFAVIAHDAGAQQIVGAFLLHRHFLVAADEDVCEEHVRIDGIPALSSAPAKAGAADQWPQRWALTEGAWLALEFSSDPAVQRHQAQLAAFMPAFRELLLEFDLAEQVGLALTARDSLRPAPNEVYFEETTATASVVTCVRDTEDIGMYINTLWVPDHTSPQMRCHQIQRCRREGSPPDDRHSYLTGHDREPG